MRKELIEYLAALAVGDPKTSAIPDSVYFAPRGWYGNSAKALVNMFRELAVLWYELPESVTDNWCKHYGSDRPNMYIRPRDYNPKTFTGKKRLQICREAFEFLEKETKPLSEGRLPCGVEQAILRLLALGKAQGHEEKALAALNKELRIDGIQLLESLSGDYEFEYGILTEPDEPLLSEADVKLRKLERGLRRLIHQVLSNAYPEEWERRLGLPEGRVEKARLLMEEARRKGSVQGGDLLLDFCELFDLTTIVKKCWDYLGQWLKDMNETIVLLEILHPLRNDLKHHRRPSREDLMLVIGIASRLCEKVGKGLMSTR